RASILAVFFLVLLIGCSRIAAPTQQSSSDIATLTNACDQGKYVSCFSLGTKYMSGSGVAKDEARAVALFQRACDNGEAQGCSGLAFMYETGNGVAKDIVRAVTLYQKACDSGDALGCALLGTM